MPYMFAKYTCGEHVLANLLIALWCKPEAYGTIGSASKAPEAASRRHQRQRLEGARMGR